MFASGLECTYSVAKWMEVGITDQDCGQLGIDHMFFSTNYEQVRKYEPVLMSLIVARGK